jgi:hypothetical protein
MAMEDNERVMEWNVISPNVSEGGMRNKDGGCLVENGGTKNQ